MKKKLILAAAAVAVIAAVAIGAMLLRPSGTQGAKEVTVTVIDQTQDPEKEVLNETFRTDAKTLSEFLEETEGLDAELSQSDYGSLLESIAGLKQDMDLSLIHILSECGPDRRKWPCFVMTAS